VTSAQSWLERLRTYADGGEGGNEGLQWTDCPVSFLDLLWRLQQRTPGLSVDAQQQLLWVEAVGVDAAETSSEENGQVRENAPQQPPEDEEGSPIWHLLQAQRRNEQGPPFPAAISKTLSLSLPDREREKGEGLEAHVRRSQKLCLVLSLSLASREGNKWMGRSEVQAGVGV